jgi:hypothetical protein
MSDSTQRLYKEGSFLISFALVIIFGIVMNIRSYSLAKKVFDLRPIHLSHEGFRYGFPFAKFWEGTCSPCDWVPMENFTAFILNFGSILIIGAVVGLCFQVFYNKLRWLVMSSR